MMAGSFAVGGDPKAEHVSAYVVLAEGPKSRLFKLSGLRSAPHVEELDAATTLDLKRFQSEVSEDLEHFGPREALDKTWACEAVRLHLRSDLGL